MGMHRETPDRLRIRIDDEERLIALQSYRILDTAPEPEYERLVDIVHAGCQAAWTMVTFVDRDRQWFKACRGLKQMQTPRSMSFCSVGMQQRTPLIVENALLDARFRDNYLVTEHGMRFFAGFPLFSSDGYGLGSISVVDLRPRTLMSHQLAILEKAQRWVQADLERRRETLEATKGSPCLSAGEEELSKQRRALRKYMAEQAWTALVEAAAVRVLSAHVG